MVRLVLAVLLTTLAVALTLWLLYRLQTIIVWGILALFLAVALQPSVNWLTRRRLPRSLAILVMYLVVFILLAGVGALVGPPLVQQGSQLLHALERPGGLASVLQGVLGPLGLGSLVERFRPQLNAIPGQLAGSLGSVPTVAAGTVSSISVPEFSSLHTASFPPASSARSRMPGRP